MEAYRLKDEARRTFLQKFEERMNTQIIHPVFKYQATYRRCIELQARLLAKALDGEINRYIPFKVR
jgi:CRISPR-associated protein Cas1